MDLNFKWVLMPFKRKEDESAGDATHTLNNYLEKFTVRIRCRAELWGHMPQQSNVAINIYGNINMFKKGLRFY